MISVSEIRSRTISDSVLAVVILAGSSAVHSLSLCPPQASDLKRHENNMHSERKQLGSMQSDTETLQAAAMAAEEQHLDTISCS